jgi:elongation factor P
MISTSDFKKGKKILYENVPYSVIDFVSVKPGKGGAFIRTKMKNLLTGMVHEETFRSGEKFESPDIEQKEMQYLYDQNDLYMFMDIESYEQYSFNKEQIESAQNFLKEQEVYHIMFFKGSPISVNPPMFMNLLVTEAPPGIKGNTAQGGGSKPVTLETGLVLQAPLFIESGDILKIDTRTIEYIERVK